MLLLEEEVPAQATDDIHFQYKGGAVTVLNPVTVLVISGSPSISVVNCSLCYDMNFTYEPMLTVPPPITTPPQLMVSPVLAAGNPSINTV